MNDFGVLLALLVADIRARGGIPDSRDECEAMVCRVIEISDVTADKLNALAAEAKEASDLVGGA